MNSTGPSLLRDWWVVALHTSGSDEPHRNERMHPCSLQARSPSRHARPCGAARGCEGSLALRCGAGAPRECGRWGDGCLRRGLHELRVWCGYTKGATLERADPNVQTFHVKHPDVQTTKRSG